LVDPPIEFAGAREIDAVEEGPGVEAGGERPVAGGERRSELPDVASNCRRVELQLVAAIDERLDGEIALEGKERLDQRVPRPLAAALGPEEGEQLIAAHPAVARGRQGGKQGEAPTRSGHRSGRLGTVDSFDRQAAERPKPQHDNAPW